MTKQVIPVEAVEAAYRAPGAGAYVNKEDVRLMLEAAAPYMLIHVHHHDIEHHARSFNEGYETCMAQELADDPTTAQDWLDEKLAGARDEGYEQADSDAPHSIKTDNPCRTPDE